MEYRCEKCNKLLAQVLYEIKDGQFRFDIKCERCGEGNFLTIRVDRAPVRAVKINRH